VFREFDLGAPLWVESCPAHLCALDGNAAFRIKNDYSFPAACTIRFRFAAGQGRPPLDLFWYDGSMKPPTPEELEAEGQELAPEGLMFVGDKGKILATFHGEDARIIPEKRMREYRSAGDRPASVSKPKDRRRDSSWVAAFKGGGPTFGNFLLAGPISDAFNLAAASLRLGGARVRFDAAGGKITNLAQANRYLTRDYRPGWEL
jgi:hypothetical protein